MRSSTCTPFCSTAFLWTRGSNEVDEQVNFSCHLHKFREARESLTLLAHPVPLQRRIFLIKLVTGNWFHPCICEPLEIRLKIHFSSYSPSFLTSPNIEFLWVTCHFGNVSMQIWKASWCRKGRKICRFAPKIDFLLSEKKMNAVAKFPTETKLWMELVPLVPQCSKAKIVSGS